MQIEIKIEEKYKEPKIIVMTDKMTDEVNAIIKRLSRRATAGYCRIQGGYGRGSGTV